MATDLNALFVLKSWARVDTIAPHKSIFRVELANSKAAVLLKVQTTITSQI